MTSRTPMDLLDYVDDLTRPHQHREPYTVELGRTGTSYTQHWTTDVPPLLHQLRYATPSGQGEERSGAGYESRPAAPLEALDALTHIDLEASRWLRDLGEDDPIDTLIVVRRLGALSPNLDRCPRPQAGCCTFHMLERALRRWWTQARVVTGWDSAAWRPNNTCPMCGEQGGLRVKLVEQVAFCVDCRETWDDTVIGLLAEHIRQESAEARPSKERLACWCPVPLPGVRKWPAPCSACASPWCHRAGWAAAIAPPKDERDTPEHAWVS